VRAALWERSADASAEVRAQAINALGRRKLLATAADSGARPEPLLYDRDFRVGVEAVRALGASPETKAPVARALGPLFGALARGADPALAQVITEAERVLQSTPLTEADATALGELAAAARQARSLPALTRGWVECLAQQGVVRAQREPDYASLQGCGLDDAWRLPLVAELIDAGVGSLAARRAALAGLLAHPDARVRGAGVGSLGSLAKAGEDADRSYAQQQLTAALDASDLVVAAAAVDAAPAVYEALDAAGQAALDAALLVRVQREQDPEVGAALLGLVGDRKLSAGAPSCRAALAANPVLAAAGAACLQALGESLPERAAVAALPALPADVAVERVLGRNLRWHLETTRGEIVIALRPDVAPWTVATIAALTQRGAYDGLAFHRVVPNFVAQGGDPTQSGYGGPGFAIPVEPATFTDSAGFERAGVGVADAGRDSGGSQFFIMQGHAPYLDGRYTWFGAVVRGQRNADALLIGDAVKRARIEIVREP
jgi:cyclophilin family peptidyl-prolyl cis-trans isomerase